MRLAGIEVAQLPDERREQVEVGHPGVPAEVLVQADHVERVVGELLGEAGPALDVERDRERGVDRARLPLRHEEEAARAGLAVRCERQLVRHRVGEHGRVIAPRRHGAPHGPERARPLVRPPEELRPVVALPDRRLVPDEDPGAVEARQQPVVHEVVRARDVRAEVLQVGHDLVHVRRGERGARARHVLVDRGPPELDAAVVQVEVAALDLDRAEADPPPLALDHPAAVAERERGRVEPRRVG